MSEACARSQRKGQSCQRRVPEVKESNSHVRGVCKKSKKGTVMSEACAKSETIGTVMSEGSARSERKGKSCQRSVQEVNERESHVRGVCKK